MFQKCLSYVLRSRLENVIAVVVSTSLLILFLAMRSFHAFVVGPLDFVFILLPVGILGLKYFLGLLAGSESPAEGRSDMKEYFGSVFRPFLGIFRDWFAFFLLNACYYSLYHNLILRVNPHVVDSLLSKADAFILGGQPSLMLESWINPWITEFLNYIYFSHLLFFPGVALFFYLAGEKKAFRRLMLGYLTIFLLGIISYILLPAAGPEKYLSDKYHYDLHGKALSRTIDYVMSAGRVSYDCFPSLHVGIPLLASFYLRDYRRKAFIPALIYVALMCYATIYLRYHYFVDVVAAFFFAPAAYLLNDLGMRHWPGERDASGNIAESAPVSAVRPEAKTSTPALQGRFIDN